MTTEERFRKLKILPINELFIYKMVIKYYHNKDLLTQISNTRINRPREYIQYQIPRSFNKCGERRIEAKVPKIFSKIPAKLQKLSSYKKIKNKLKSYLLDNFKPSTE